MVPWRRNLGREVFLANLDSGNELDRVIHDSGRGSFAGVDNHCSCGERFSDPGHFRVAHSACLVFLVVAAVAGT